MVCGMLKMTYIGLAHVGYGCKELMERTRIFSSRDCKVVALKFQILGLERAEGRGEDEEVAVCDLTL